MQAERLSGMSTDLLDSLVEQVAILDDEGTIVHVNEEWRRSAERGGIPEPAASVGTSYVAAVRRAALRDPSVSAVVSGLEQVLAGTLRCFEHEYECSHEGHVRWFRQRAMPLRGATRGAVIAHLDITDRKLAEQQREAQRFELRRAVRAATLGQLSGALAHELNQPLTAILANVQVVASSAPTLNLSAELAETFADIEADARRAGEMINRLRNLLQSHETTFELVDLNELIEDTLSLCRSELLLQRVDVVRALSAGPVHAWGDPIELQHLLLNLIINAYQAMSSTPIGNRELRISSSVLRSGDACVVIADSGHGIQAAERERIFEALYTTKKGGMGLGLSICRSIVDVHGGWIRIENGPTGGAAATVELPGPPAEHGR